MAVPIKLFALSTCGHCKAVKELLRQYDLKVDVVNVDRLEGDERDTVIAEVKRYNARISFPTTVIGEQVIVGNKADRIQKALAELSTAALK